ncbi:hypothetical protein OJ996_06195 [Luteolibacter sp. GHJ8]|uniref:DUF302 domain-containing protein n=1 Tax=Luteolibacter rhizosphaerae TaxID=2989719 RepID=A0ABT3FZY8_9BACT|nr:hypothetical protein [Luteolibacter rhizosphaerae]MCW1913153.1 hypothetical protein [Luteolibacter rhizosphaerae]
MLRKLPLVVALVVMTVILLLLSREDVGDMGPVAEEREAVTSPVFLPENMAGTEGMAVEPAEPVVAIEETEAPTRQKVFRLVLDGDRCALEAMEEVSGHFGRERQQEWMPGMLCCRLISDAGEVLDERTIPAPDRMCVVLDPNVPNAASTVVRMTPEGPSVFQVRFPETGAAARLEVSRISTIQRPADQSTAIGSLLASIPIPR